MHNVNEQLGIGLPGAKAPFMWIKICGIRDRATARQVADLGADAIGLNFYAKSPRHVDLAEAIEICRTLPPEIARVGVFVNHSLAGIIAIARQCELDRVQLHGDESPSFVGELHQQLPETKLIRAWRMAAGGLDPLRDYLAHCRKESCTIAECLIDAHVPGMYGGSGQTVPWENLALAYQASDLPPLVLAGGLTPLNIAQAISVVQPWGVDVASGIESAPGVKDLELMKQFVTNARNAQH